MRDSREPGWREARRKFTERQPCSKCGKPGIRHHKDRNPGNNDPANVEWLCRGCHTKEHIVQGEISKDSLTGRWAKTSTSSERTQCLRGHDLNIFGCRAFSKSKNKPKRFYLGCRECSRLRVAARRAALKAGKDG